MELKQGGRDRRTALREVTQHGSPKEQNADSRLTHFALDRRTFVSGGAALAGLASSARASTQKSGGGRGEAKAMSALQDYMRDHRTQWGIPGMTLAVVNRDGFTGYVRSGDAHVDRKTRVGADHLWQVGSITKMMTGLAVWSLIDEGKTLP